MVAVLRNKQSGNPLLVFSDGAPDGKGQLSCVFPGGDRGNLIPYMGSHPPRSRSETITTYLPV